MTPGEPDRANWDRDQLKMGPVLLENNFVLSWTRKCFHKIPKNKIKCPSILLKDKKFLKKDVTEELHQNKSLSSKTGSV